MDQEAHPLATYSDWNINLAGQQGQQGTSGPAGPSGPQGVPGPIGSGYQANSNTPLPVATGSTTLAAESGLAYSAGARVRLSSRGTANAWMEGLVTSYSGSTLVVNVDLTGTATGSYSDWNINLAGQQGATGPTGGSSVYVSDTPPTGVADNSLWFESDTGLLYIYFFDGDSRQWVIATPFGNSSMFVRIDAVQNLSATQQTQGRENIYAAPFDALAYNGMQVNGSCDVSQLIGTNAVTSAVSYTLDNWFVNWAGPTLSWAQVTDAPPGYSNSLKGTVTTADASPASTDIAFVRHTIEGYRAARLAFGTASAAPLSIGFWAKTSRTGTYSLSIATGLNTRAYATTYIQAAVGVWQYNAVTIPGDVTGTWPSDNSIAITLRFYLMAGSSQTTNPNVWAGTAAAAATGQVNGVAATSDYFQITGLVMLPGIELPAASRAPFIMRPRDQELMLCRRYFQWNGGINDTTWGIYNSQWAEGSYRFNPTMRAVPTCTVYNGTTSGQVLLVGGATTAANVQAITVSTDGCCTLNSLTSAFTGTTMVQFNLLADARL